jgi:dolichyl-phosphate beta-glucosyltransferase
LTLRTAEALTVDQTVLPSNLVTPAVWGANDAERMHEVASEAGTRARASFAPNRARTATSGLRQVVLARTSSADSVNETTLDTNGLIHERGKAVLNLSSLAPFESQGRGARQRRLPSAEFDSIALQLAKGAITLDLCLVIPMYNEANRIAASIKTLSSSALCGDRVGFVFVDDGSTDNTVSVAQSAIEEFELSHAQVLVLKANVGKGGAVRAGILAAAASAHYVGYLDADLSLDPSDVASAFTRMRASNVDVLVGDRIVDSTKQPKLRRIASLTFRSLAALAAPTGVRDTQCAMKLFRADVARNVFEPLQTNGFGFDVEVLVRSRAIGARVDELPIAWTHTEGSSVNAATESFRMMRDVLKVRRALLNQ